MKAHIETKQADQTEKLRKPKRPVLPFRRLLHFHIAIGMIALVNYFSWWFKDDRLTQPLFLIFFIFAIAYASTQMVANWILYLFAHRTHEIKTWPEGLSIDVFVTAYDEPYDMVKRTLSAACSMYGEHRTWLLDDGSKSILRALAQELGAGYLSRSDHHNAKAGNINYALEKTSGDIIVIFDLDHVPRPEFLIHCLWHFTDPQVGFVQAMLTFKNPQESWIAKAAVETSLEFYNPTSLGADGLGGATLMGSNALIRRTALASIGGYQPGLAEDLATSIALHAAGWKSAYVAQPLAPGLAPPSISAWFIQQLKWARGVFELLITTYPRLFRRLSWGQRISYIVRLTKYWIGPVVSAHLLATILILIFGKPALQIAFHEYLIRIAPLAIADVVIRFLAMRHYRGQAVGQTSLFRAVALVYATWPIYTLAWGMAVLRLPIKFRPTPKTSSGQLSLWWLLPQILAVLLLSMGAVYTVLWEKHSISILLLFASIQGFLQLNLLFRWWYSLDSFTPIKPKDVISGAQAVLDVDFDQLPEQITGLESYSSARLLVRINHIPVGFHSVAVEQGGVIPIESLRSAILENADWSFWQRWAQWRLGWERRPTTAAPLPATVAICTRDRPDDLRRCLEALKRLPDDGQEVIVVDSCSQSEATRAIVSDFPQVRYLREELPGLNRARNRALHEAVHPIVAFIDDDATPDPGWLRALAASLQEPGAMCVTGLTLPAELDTSAQQWFEQHSTFNRGFVRRIFDKDNLHPLAAGHAGAGVNMALLRSIFTEIGPFAEVLDAGTPTQSGGDTEMFSRILASGNRIVYEPEAICWHRHRRTQEKVRSAIYGYGVGTYAFWAHNLLQNREWTVLIHATEWALYDQIPRLIRTLLHRPGSFPLDLLLAELKGCLAGPAAYRASQKQLAVWKTNGQLYDWSAAASQRHYSNS